METLGAATCVVWLLQSLQVMHLRALLTAWKWEMLVCGISKDHEIMVRWRLDGEGKTVQAAYLYPSFEGTKLVPGMGRKGKK